MMGFISMQVLTDIAIIGAGIMGASICRELSKYNISTVVVEKNIDVCSGTSKATSSVIHSSIHQIPGTLKAKLGIKGNALYTALCSELNVRLNRCGSLVMALCEDDMNIIRSYKSQGEKNGEKGLRIIKREELKRLEPNISDEVIAALFSPTDGMVDPYELTFALIENACENGVRLFVNSPVIEIENSNCGWSIITNKGTIKTKYIINAAGIYADEISMLAGDDSFKIMPLKGEEYICDRNIGCLINHIIETASLGVGIFPTVHGNLMLATTSVKASKNDFSTTKEGLEHILPRVQRLIAHISKKDIITSFAGLRPMNNMTNDFIIEPSKKAKNFINVSIGTPGIYAAPAIAKMVIDILKDLGVLLKKKDNYNPYRKSMAEFKNLTDVQKINHIDKDEKYGHVVCRCETVTEAQIIEAIKRGARTLDGVKYRTRAGMGRCQGGFCTPRILKIMSRELGIPVTEITKKGGDSVIMPFAAKKLLKEAKVNG